MKYDLACGKFPPAFEAAIRAELATAPPLSDEAAQRIVALLLTGGAA